ncbi:carbonic anhydrase [Paractinoplanes abujensis]|uniref:Carbonic anhydrase n=1 Tax=Paractinoplanes abujensis TaxID=882441 RepID=A0A7W7G4K9_9ACTN|nr:carbonic anhydrase [Actinoplanes abujensis]MBB4697478.1 carbonic anhydrase [Actinoplanes abujensis]GID18047.1 carbonic anhydrase [Actinoplanes abujensis]
MSIGRRSLLAAGATALAATVVPTAAHASAEPASPGTYDEAIRELLRGNRRFVTGHLRHPHQNVAAIHRLAAAQDPFVITLGCADSRVPSELLFDQGLGDIFDNRVAGNIVDDLLLGSMEYAVEHFDPPLLLVLGHERCGAISATVDILRSGGEAPGHIAAIVDALTPIVEPVLSLPGDPVENGVVANVRAQVAALTASSPIIREKVEAGHLGVAGARYDLDTGKVTLL